MNISTETKKLIEEIKKHYKTENIEGLHPYYWVEISGDSDLWKNRLTEEFIKMYAHRLSFLEIAKNQKLSFEFIEENIDLFSDPWGYSNISFIPDIIENMPELAEKYIKDIDWKYQFKNFPVSKDFIEKHFDTLVDAKAFPELIDSRVNKFTVKNRAIELLLNSNREEAKIEAAYCEDFIFIIMQKKEKSQRINFFELEKILKLIYYGKLYNKDEYSLEDIKKYEKKFYSEFINDKKITFNVLFKEGIKSGSPQKAVLYYLDKIENLKNVIDKEQGKRLIKKIDKSLEGQLNKFIKNKDIPLIG